MSWNDAGRRGHVAGRVAWPVAVALCLAGCVGADPAELPRQGSRQTDGPLSASTGSGEFVAARSKDNPREWSQTFGAFLLCSTEPDQEIDIQRVRFDADPEPLTVETWYRIVPPVTERARGPRAAWWPYTSLRGTPPFGDEVGGQVVRSLDGPIGQECDEVGPRHGYTELMTAMTVGEAGALVERTYVDYTVEGQPYTLVIPWRNGVCGSAVTGRGCRPTGH